MKMTLTTMAMMMEMMFLLVMVIFFLMIMDLVLKIFCNVLDKFLTKIARDFW